MSTAKADYAITVTQTTNASHGFPKCVKLFDKSTTVSDFCSAVFKLRALMVQIGQSTFFFIKPVGGTKPYNSDHNENHESNHCHFHSKVYKVKKKKVCPFYVCGEARQKSDASIGTTKSER